MALVSFFRYLNCRMEFKFSLVGRTPAGQQTSLHFGNQVFTVPSGKMAFMVKRYFISLTKNACKFIAFFMSTSSHARSSHRPQRNDGCGEIKWARRVATSILWSELYFATNVSVPQIISSNFSRVALILPGCCKRRQCWNCRTSAVPCHAPCRLTVRIYLTVEMFLTDDGERGFHMSWIFMLFKKYSSYSGPSNKN